MTSKKLALMLPLLVFPLAGCNPGISVKENVSDITIKTPVALDAGNIIESNAYIYQKVPLFTTPLDGRIKDIKVTGTATLSAPATTALKLNVYLAENFENLNSVCLPLDSGAYKGCATVGNGVLVGSITVPAGETVGAVGLGVNEGSTFITRMAHEGKGHLGLHIEQGRLDAGSTIKLTGMVASAKATLFQ